MSDYSGNLIPCPEIQDTINKYFTQDDAELIVGNIGALDFLTSPMNKAGTNLQQVISPGNAKKRQVVLTYTQRYLMTQVSDVATQVCTSVNEDGETSETYEIDESVGSSINRKIDIADHVDRCEDTDAYYAKQILRMIAVMDRKINKDSLSQMAALFGAFNATETDIISGADGAPQIKRVYTRLSTDNRIDPSFITKIKFAAMNANYSSFPVLIGWDEILQTLDEIKSGCCADSGLDFGDLFKRFQMAFVADENMPTVMGNSTDFLTVGMGAAQFIYFNKFRGINGGVKVKDTPIYKQTIVVSPRTGIPYDLVMNFDCGVVHTQLSLAHKVVGLPDDLFQNGDNLRGVNWINKWRTDTRS